MKLLLLLAGLAVWLARLSFCQADTQPPQILLTPKLLRRLVRDRDRQTLRWVNFNKRVETVPDSPERGFELALYYAVTKDKKRGQQAIAWALVHKCERRQVALVIDWISDLLQPADKAALLAAECETGSDVSLLKTTRDRAFLLLANDQDIHALVADSWPIFRKNLHDASLLRSDALYALCEFLQVVRTRTHTDLRQDEPEFFSRLPKEYILSLHPSQVEHPEWLAHIAGLATVALDPNLENSQFLQAWAMETPQTLHDGPGVAYEFLWADPYLPGIAYQNMDPWVYDSAGLLIARTTWELNACWLSIRPESTSQQNCGSSFLRQPVQFGTMRLLPFAAPCSAIPTLKNNEEAIFANVGKNASVVVEQDRSRATSNADPAGLWRAPTLGSGNVCLASHRKR